jgi:hypothetical protein
MEKENVTWKLVAIYKGKDGYGYGIVQTKTVEKEFDSISDLRDWIFDNGSIDDFSGYNVKTVLHLSSYKTYEIKCIECYEDDKSYTSFKHNREFKIGDEVLHVVSDTRIKSPLKGVVKSISYGKYMDVEFDGYGIQTFDFDDMSIYKD